MPSNQYGFTYKHQLRKECSQRSKEVSTTVFGMTYADDISAQEEERYVIACSSNGMICIWDTVLNRFHNGTNSYHDPVFSFKVCNGILYDVQFVHSSSVVSTSASASVHSSLLIACGECGVFVYDWKEIQAYITDRGTGGDATVTKNTATTPAKLKPISTMHPYPISSLIPTEVNRISYDKVTGYLYGACGDSFGGTIWDINTNSLLGTLGGGALGVDCQRGQKQQLHNQQSNYLLTIKIADSKIDASNHLVLTGGDNGQIGVWNRKESKLIQMINIKSALIECHTMNTNDEKRGLVFTSSDSKSTFSHIKANNSSSFWVSSIDVDESCEWAVISGGIEYGKKSDKLDNGYLALMNLQTRKFSTCSTTRETINDVAFHSPSNKILSVGNNNIVSYWNQSDLSKGRIGNAWVSSPSSFSIAIQNKTGMVAIAGVGNLIDCYSHHGIKSSTLKFEA
jgi:hypothetical protein